MWLLDVFRRFVLKDHKSVHRRIDARLRLSDRRGSRQERELAELDARLHQIEEQAGLMRDDGAP